MDMRHQPRPTVTKKQYFAQKKEKTKTKIHSDMGYQPRPTTTRKTIGIMLCVVLAQYWGLPIK
jgi:hypothetical protein